MADGVDTPRGYLGHTGSVTVVTHNVITSGQLPKHMGWTARATATSTTCCRRRARQRRATSGSPATGRQRCSAAAGTRATPSSPTTSTRRTGPSRSRSARRRTPRSRSAARRPTRSSRSAAAPPARRHPGCVGARAARHQPAVVPHRGLRPLLRADGSALRYDTRRTPASLYPLDGDRYTTGKDLRTRAVTSGPPTRRSTIMRNEATGADLREPARRRQGGPHVGRRGRPRTAPTVTR